MNRVKITERGALKEVVKFAKREFREKKPLAGCVLRIKDVKKISIGGPLPQRGVIEHQKGLQGSLYCVCAELNDEILGMARVIRDSRLYFYIQDVIVLPQYQKMGIGILMMERVMNFLDNNISPLTVVGLMASKGKEPFYEKFGFTTRPSERRGHGMFRIWKYDSSL